MAAVEATSSSFAGMMRVTDPKLINTYVREIQGIMNDRVSKAHAHGLEFSSPSGLRAEAVQEFSQRHPEIDPDQAAQIGHEAGRRFAALTAVTGRGPLPPAVRFFAAP